MAIENLISVDELAVGIFVHLDLGWTKHPFSFNSFKIRSEEQLAIIRQLGLNSVRWSPERSDVSPLPRAVPLETVASAEVTPAPPARESGLDSAVMAAKQARIQRLQEHRERIARVENEFIRSAKIVRALDQTLYSLPDQALGQASELIDSMSDTLLAAPDLAIHLMSEHSTAEEAYSHPLNVSVLAMLLARDLKLPTELVRLVGLGALFHDIGLSRVPARIANHSGAMPKADRDFLVLHCQYGVEIGKKAGLPATVLQIIQQHHECYDGSGYPGKLKGEAIFPLARIVALANAFESMCNTHNTAHALTPHEALAQMFAQFRSRFDPQLLKQFIRFMGVYPPGTVVSLSNGALGMVIAVDASHPLKPTVVVYDQDVPKREAIVLDLAEETEVNITRGIRPDQLLPVVFDYLSPRRRTTFYFEAANGPGGPAA